jgi:hypothetical protein
MVKWEEGEREEGRGDDGHVGRNAKDAEEAIAGGIIPEMMTQLLFSQLGFLLCLISPSSISRESDGLPCTCRSRG